MTGLPLTSQSAPPPSEVALLEAAQQLMTQGEFVEAAKTLNLAISIYPEWAEAHYMLGEIFLAAENFPVALERFQRAAELQPGRDGLNSKIEVCTLMAAKNPLVQHGPTKIGFADLRSGQQTPVRTPLFPNPLAGLALQISSYVEGVTAYLESHTSQEGTFSVLARGKGGPDVLKKFENSALAGRLDVLMLDVETHTSIGNPATYQRTDMQVQFTSEFLFVHLDKDETPISILSEYLRNAPSLAVAKAFPRTLQIVFLNGTVAGHSIADLTNPNPTVMLTTPRCGTSKFLPSFNHIAHLTGRPYRDLSTNAGRSRRLLEMESENSGHGDFGPYEEYYLHAIQTLNYFELANIHKVIRLERILKSPHADFIVMIRDPRDLAVSAATAQLFHYGIEPTPESMAEYLEERLRNFIPKVLRMFQDTIGAENCFQVKFEDNLADSRGLLVDLIAWLGWKPDITEADLTFALDLTDTERLRKKRDEKAGDAPYELTWVEGVRFRKGSAGDWRNHFSERQKDFMKEIAGQLLIDLGYADDTNW